MMEINTNELLSSFARMSKQWGLGESVGRIWGFLLLEARPLSQKQIEESINYSRGLISRSLTKLIELGMIEKFKEGRESYYSANTSLISGFNRVMEDFLRTDIEPVIKYLSRNLGKIEDETTRAKIRRMISEYERLDIGISVFSKIMKRCTSLDPENFTREKITKYFKNQLKMEEKKDDLSR